MVARPGSLAIIKSSRAYISLDSERCVSAVHASTMKYRWLHMIMRALVVLLAIGGAYVVVNRLVAITTALQTGFQPSSESFEAPFLLRPDLAFLHLLPAALFIILGPLQFVRSIRNQYPYLHRWSGRIYLAASLLIAYSAAHLALNRSFGGPSETAATVFFVVIFIVCLATAFWHICHRHLAQHREWMIRGFAIGIAVVTIRPVVGLYILFSDYSVQEILGTAFWISFTTHLIIAEVWINFTRQKWRLTTDC